MSLQDLELSPFLISELYRDTLVSVKTGEAIEEPPIASKPTPATEVSGYAPAEQEKPTVQQEESTHTIKFLGGNKKRIAFIVNCNTDVFLPDTHLDWLGKMLDACKLNLGDVAIANIANNQFTIADIKNELQSTSVILLGTEPFALQLPLNFPHFNLQSYDGMTFLNTPSPDQLNQSTNEAKLLKSKLWVCLQKLFKL